MTGQAETGQAETGQAETGQADARRAGLVAAAQERWAEALTDLGGRNTLLYYKDRRAGTLDLAAAAPEALDRLQRSGTIRLTRLFHDVDARADAIRRMQAIHRKARELAEERGLAASYLVAGLARWDELNEPSMSPNAPCRDYFAAAIIGVQSFLRAPGRTRHGHFGCSATNAVYVVLVMRLLSPHYAAACYSG